MFRLLGLWLLNVSFSLYKSIQVCPGIFVRLCWLISRIPQHIIACFLPSPSPSLSPLLVTVLVPTPCRYFITVHYSVTPTAVDAVGSLGWCSLTLVSQAAPHLLSSRHFSILLKGSKLCLGAYISIIV